MIAEQDKAITELIETAVVEAYGLDQWASWKPGVKSHPPNVRKEPAFCIMLYDRAYDCAIRNHDKGAGEFGGVCRPEQRLHDLCAAGNTRAFYEYLEFSRKRERGDFVVETDRTAAGSLKSLSIVGMGGYEPGFRYSRPGDFRPSYRQIVREDINVASTDRPNEGADRTHSN